MGSADVGFKALLFKQVVDAAGLRQRLGATASAEIIERHDEIFRECLAEVGGTERRHPGDRFFATIALPSEALLCALSFRIKPEEGNPAEPLGVRIDIHAGEVDFRSGGKPDDEREAAESLAVDTAGSGRELSTLGSHKILGWPVFSYDERRVAVLTDSLDVIRVWDPDSGHALYTLGGTPPRYSGPNSARTAGASRRSATTSSLSASGSAPGGRGRMGDSRGRVS